VTGLEPRPADRVQENGLSGRGATGLRPRSTD
jgi:hypothetical protein